MKKFHSQPSEVSHFLAIGAVLLFLIWGCSGDGIGLDINGNPVCPGTPDTTISYSRDIQPIFSQSCSCHLGGGAPLELDLSTGNSYNNLVNVPSSAIPSLDRVEPTGPATSSLA